MSKLDKVRRIVRFRLNTDEWLMMAHSGLTLAEQGKLMDDVCIACLRGDVDYIRSLPFIAGFHFEAKGREGIPLCVRRAILARGICALCGAIEKLTVDHIRPVSEEGTNEIWNLQCLCAPCNRKKGPQSWSKKKRLAGNAQQTSKR